MAALNFHRVSDKMPDHDDEVVWCNRHNGVPMVGTVERFWDEVDLSGESTGYSMTYTDKDVEVHEDPDLRWRLGVSVNGVEMDQKDFWIDMKSYANFVAQTSKVSDHSSIGRE